MAVSEVVPVWLRRRSIRRIIDEAAAEGLTQRDQGLLTQLLNARGRLGFTKAVSYYLYLPDEESARLAANDVRRAGFDALLRPPLSEYPDQWPIIAIKSDITLTIEMIRANSSFFESIASRFNGEYDGWQAT